MDLFFSKSCKCIFFFYDFHNYIFFSLTYFIIRIQYIVHTTYKICVNWLFMLSVRHEVSSGLSVARFWGHQELHTGVRTSISCFGGPTYVLSICHLLTSENLIISLIFDVLIHSYFQIFLSSILFFSFIVFACCIFLKTPF